MNAFESKPIEFSACEFAEHFERRPFFVTHELKTHPLFQIDALLEASDRLPASLIECNAGSVPISLPEGRVAGHGLTPREICALMPDEKVWLGLKKIDLVPEYREVIETLLSSVRSATASSYPGMYNLEGYVFISSPGTIVPYHMDTEHNFLLQIRGDKSMYVLDRFDPAVLCEEDIERYYTNTTRRMTFDDSMHDHVQRWYLDPGKGMHVPINFPHYVETGSDISISLSATFDTPRQQARACIYKVNYHLRKLGIKPAPYGSSAWSDRLKSAAGLAYQKIRRA